MYQELLTIPQFCAAVNIGSTKFYSLLKEQKIAAVKLGKKTLIKREEVERFISELTDYNSNIREL